jgi:cell division septum initiation protein DivIVA
MSERQPANEHDPKADEPGVIPGARQGGRGSPPPASASLEQQIAALAAQVRGLGQRLVSARQSTTVSSVAAESPLRGPGGRRVAAIHPATNSQRSPETQRDVPADDGPNESHRPPPAGVGDAGGVASENIIAMAEVVADEIRANAEREALRIREADANDAGEHLAERLAELLAVLARQAESVAILTAEVARIEQSAAVFREQALALETELQETLASISALTRVDS